MNIMMQRENWVFEFRKDTEKFSRYEKFLLNGKKVFADEKNEQWTKNIKSYGQQD